MMGTVRMSGSVTNAYARTLHRHFRPFKALTPLELLNLGCCNAFEQRLNRDSGFTLGHVVHVVLLIR